MTTLQATVPEKLVKEVNRLVKLGLFKDESEVVEVALKKMLAEQSREYLRDLVKNMGIKKREMLDEWKKMRV